MNPEELLAAANEAPHKVQLEDYRDAVDALRQKGYSWREVADFLSERGVTTDHSRVYRLFGAAPKKPSEDARPIEVARMSFLGERPTKRGRSWNVVEIELPSKLGVSMPVVGYVWGADNPLPGLQEGDSVSFRNATLVTRSGRRGFPMAYLKVELEGANDHWAPHDIYVTPEWSSIL